ncbi:MAG: cupin domain-containing protein [Pseudonocardiaceae bacterium]|nr:cupin domain-containing protein [Pseudonocardiaceae bacterium]
MHLVSEPTHAVDLSTTPVHLGLGSRAMPVEGFGWDPDVLEAYGSAVADDGAEGRLLMIFEGAGSGTYWERHPAGDEVVICLSGRMTVTRVIGGTTDPVDLTLGEAMINPRGVWHVVDVHEPGQLMTITPGAGTEHRPRR